jgi:uncharacterized protein (TIGR02452 family)
MAKATINQLVPSLTAAHSLLQSCSEESSRAAKDAKVAILNMASPLSPGGGFLNGATSQEETLCMRTTLLPSLKDDYYRLPELGVVFTPDVLVFRNEGCDELLAKSDRWFVDCITAAMLRNPDLDQDDMGQSVYANDHDRQLVLQKMRLVLRVCEAKGIKKIVLGAWGCGAYGNPVNEIASARKKVLLPKRNDQRKRNKETWPGIEEVVFAIKNVGMANAFEIAFGDGLIREDMFGEDEDAGDEPDQGQEHEAELLEKIDEMEERIERTENAQVGQRGSVVSWLG